eukprot:gene11786-2117_t
MTGSGYEKNDTIILEVIQILCQYCCRTCQAPIRKPKIEGCEGCDREPAADKARWNRDVACKSESVVPVESVAPVTEEVEELKEEDKETAEGFVVRNVIRRPLFLTSKRTVVRKVEITDDGEEREVAADVVEDVAPVASSEQMVTHRTVAKSSEQQSR